MCGPYLILKPKAPISTPIPIQTKITISPPPPPYTTAIFSTTAFLLLQQSSRRGNLYNIQACTLMATSSISATGFSSSSSSFRGSWKSSICGEDGAPNMLNKCAPNMVRVGKPVRLRIVMGNVNEGKGIFAPAVVVARNIIGKKRFNQLRGKAIALHSQVITEFCKSIGADAKQRQGLIRLAKKNGEKLGFLA